MRSSGEASIRLLVIVGPTACGKTRLGVEIAHRLGSEILSADSRQTYRGLDLGTGKEQTVRIEQSSGLNEAEIEEMRKDADAHAEDDKLKRELVAGSFSVGSPINVK